MLKLERKPGTAVRIGPEIRVIIEEVRGRKVKLLIEAPLELRIWREDAVELGTPCGGRRGCKT